MLNTSKSVMQYVILYIEWVPQMILELLTLPYDDSGFWMNFSSSELAWAVN